MLHSEAGWRVGEPSFVTYRREPPASRTARFGTTCRSKPGRSPKPPLRRGAIETCPRSFAPIAVPRARHLHVRHVAARSKAATWHLRTLEPGAAIARRFRPPSQGGTAWGRCRSLFLGFDDPPHRTRQGLAADGVNVDESAQAVQPADSGSAVQPCRLKLDTTLVLDMQSGADHPGSSTGPEVCRSRCFASSFQCGAHWLVWLLQSAGWRQGSR